MQTLLLGRWNNNGDLVITESHQTDDQAEIDERVAWQNDALGMAWAASFETDDHDEALATAYGEYICGGFLTEGNVLIDQVTGAQLGPEL